LAFLTQNKAKLWKILTITLFFFRRKLSKIAENRDHNIDPSLGEFSPMYWAYYGQFFESYRISPNAWTFFLGKSYVLILAK
jgi:hypothetical protein